MVATVCGDGRGHGNTAEWKADRMKIKLTNVSNTAAFGAEWTTGHNGNRFQLVTPRGTAELFFGVLSEGSTEWRTTRVVDPSRFGMDGPPRTIVDFLDIAEKYVNPD